MRTGWVCFNEHKWVRFNERRRWSEVFPNAACVVSLVDRLVHNAEIISIEGESYRLKEARERSEQRAQKRKKKAKP